MVTKIGLTFNRIFQFTHKTRAVTHPMRTLYIASLSIIMIRNHILCIFNRFGIWFYSEIIGLIYCSVAQYLRVTHKL